MSAQGGRKPGDRDALYAGRIVKNHMSGSAVNSYFNEATRMYTMGKLMALIESEGQYATTSAVFAVLSNSFFEVNGGHNEEMHSIFGGLLSGVTSSTEGPARVMIAQAKPTPLGDRNGRGAPLSPTKDDFRKMLVEKDKMIADMGNQMAQDKANKDKNKKARTEAYNQRVLKRAANEAQGQGPRKKVSPPKAPPAQPAQPAQHAGPARGFLLRTSNASDDESDSEVEFEDEPMVERACCVRVVEPAQPSKPELAPRITSSIEREVSTSRSIRERNSRSASNGVPFSSIQIGNEIPDD